MISENEIRAKLKMNTTLNHNSITIPFNEKLMDSILHKASTVELAQEVLRRKFIIANLTIGSKQAKLKAVRRWEKTLAELTKFNSSNL